MEIYTQNSKLEFKQEKTNEFKLILEKHEDVEINLGINKVKIFYSTKGWNIETNTNIQIKKEKVGPTNLNIYENLD